MSTPTPLDTLFVAETPEGIALALRPAGLVARLYAASIDTAIRLALMAAATIALQRLGNLGLSVFLLLWFALEWLYPVLFELTLAGATPGKRALSLRVVMDSGLPVTPAASVLRNLLRAADFLPFGYAAGALCLLLRPDFKRFGDLAAGTLVVHHDAPGRAIWRRRGLTQPEAPWAGADPIALRSSPSPRQQAAVLAWAGRADRLTQERLDELAQLAQPLLATIAAEPQASKAAPARERLLGVAHWLWGESMTPRDFEAAYAPLWDELEAGLDGLADPAGLAGLRGSAARQPASVPAERVVRLYRATCEHLALARDRAYPMSITDRLEALTELAHRTLYRTRGDAATQLHRLFAVDFPQCVRAHRTVVLLSLAAFVLPLLITGWLTWRDPGFVLTVHPMAQVREFEQMYDAGNEAFGRPRGADTDWAMFGLYVWNNLSIAFQCFAGGLFAGIGSLLYLGYNAVVFGTLSGYLAARGHGEAFFSFVVTHGALELTAIVLSGAAGLALGSALLAPGRRSRWQALSHAALGLVPMLYGLSAMLLGAAVLEAFWSSARWIEPWVKFSVGGALWLAVLAYFVLQGAPRRRGDAG